MSNILHIQIPVELARYSVWQRAQVNKYETNQVIKALDTWLTLKAESIPSLIQDWNKQKERLLYICKCSESIFRHRLKLLVKLKLVQFDRHNIKLCSWDELSRALEIDCTYKKVIRYDVTTKQRLQEWLMATEIEDNQSRQAYAVIKTLNKNPNLKLKIQHAIIAAGADRNQVNDPGYILTWMRVLYTQDFYRASDIHDLLIEIRPDLNRSVRGIANAWKAKHITTVSYWKSVMESAGIIAITKAQIESETRTRNTYCKVLWLKQAKKTLLCLCDQIIVLDPDYQDNRAAA